MFRSVNAQKAEGSMRFIFGKQDLRTIERSRENLFMLTNADSDGALDHQVELLAVMGCGMDGLVLKIL